VYSKMGGNPIVVEARAMYHGWQQGGDEAD